jgi:hypothetical protein
MSMRLGAGLIVIAAIIFIVALRASGSSGAQPQASVPGRATATPVGARVPQAPVDRPSSAGPSLLIEVTKRSRFAWPAVGNVTSFYGPGHPLGIDISLDPNADSPVRAAAAGVVTFAGGDACCEYGLHVEVDHGGGWSTLYGHLAQVLVSEGQEVEQGDLIGFGGATGDAAGKHLHFELHQGGSTVDPLRYLPSVQESPPQNVTQLVSCPLQVIRVDPASTVSLVYHASDTPLTISGFSLTVSDPDPVYAPPVATRDGDQEITVTVPAANVASGLTDHYHLVVMLEKSGGQQSVDCELDLRTMQTQPNDAATIDAYNARFAEGTPTPTPTPSASPTKTPKPGSEPSATSTAKPTRTPYAQPVASRTPIPTNTPRTAPTPFGRQPTPQGN